MVGGQMAFASEEVVEIERRCATQERTNEALREQLDQLTWELKELRRSPQAELFSQAERAAKGTGMTPVEGWCRTRAPSASTCESSSTS